jgi:hypothetical protein
MAFTIQVPGPCTITYGTLAAPEAFGVALDGVTITSQMIWTPIVADVLAGSPVDYIFGGRNVTVSFQLADIAALANTFFLGSLGKLGTAADPGTVVICPATLSTRALRITERESQGYWQADYAVPLDPAQLLLAATQELRIPFEFKILPNAKGQLFSALPSYITTTA